MEDGHQSPGAQGKGEHHTGHSHGERLGANGDQFFQFTLQASEEQQGVEPELRHRFQRGETLVVDPRHGIRGDIHQAAHQTDHPIAELHLRFRRHQQVQTGGTDQYSREQFPKDRGQLKAHQHLRQQARSHENQGETGHPNQGFGHFKIMGGDLGQQGHEQGRHRSSEHRNRESLSRGPYL